MLDVQPLVATNKTASIIRCGSVTLYPDHPTEVPMAFLGEYGYLKGVHFDFSRLADQYRTRAADGRPYFDLICPLSGVDGYGRHAISVFQGLVVGRMAEVTLRESWITSSWDSSHVGSEIQALVQSSCRKLPAKVAVTFSLPYDPMGYENQSIIKIWITQFETDRFPRKHVEKVNRADHLIVTSKFQVPMMRASGIKIPISVMTAGVDTDYFAYRERQPEDTFKVLMLGALTGRKDPMGAIAIFREASQGHKAWRLTLKTRPNTDGFEKVQDHVRALNDDRIEVLVGDTHPSRLVGYYYSHDCLLWPSRAEGCGLPPLEAMSTGMEVVCADNSGMSDYLSSEWAWPIKTAGMEPAGWPEQEGGFSQKYVEAYGEVGSWWVVDHDHAVKQLRRCYNEWIEGRGKGQKAAEYVRANHSLEHQARSVVDVVEAYIDQA